MFPKKPVGDNWQRFLQAKCLSYDRNTVLNHNEMNRDSNCSNVAEEQINTV